MMKNAEQIMKDSIVIDGHFAIELAMPRSLESKFKLIDEYYLAGVNALSLSLANDESKLEETLLYLAQVRQFINKNKDKYILAMNTKDILRAKAEGKLALRLMFQGTAPLNLQLDLLEIYKTLGISSLVIAYNIRTPMGDGVIEEVDAGISHLGKRFVAEMNRHALLLDGAHSSKNTIEGMIAASEKPVVISHAGVYAINPLPRNVRDDQIKALAAKGGLLGINGIGLLLGDKNASVQKYVDHVDYVVKLVGPEYVGIGLDHLYFPDQFNEFMHHQPITNPSAYGKMIDPAMLKSIHPRQIVQIVDEMINRNYSEETIRLILGENWLRVMRAHDSD